MTTPMKILDGELVPFSAEDLARLASEPVAVEPMPSLTREKLIAGLLDDDFITPEEAAADGLGVIPVAIKTVIDAAFPDPKQNAREVVRWHNMNLAYRDHPLTLMIQASRQMSDADVDAMWRRWATL